jgi:hypothetical protein
MSFQIIGTPSIFDNGDSGDSGVDMCVDIRIVYSVAPIRIVATAERAGALAIG